MTDPNDTNDDWADLAREFALDKPAAPPPDTVERKIEEEAVEPHRGFDPRGDEAAADGETESEASDEEFEDAEDAPAGEATADGEQPGTGRKRRRRRRRRRKGGAGAEVAAPAAEADAEPEGAPDAEPAEEFEPEPEAESFAEDEADDSDAAPLAAEEDTASEVLRELIATWNVPSWDEIVDGLYRPH
jgi:ribonuclease E